MPYIRSQNGSRKKFYPNIISDILTKVFTSIHGPDVYLHRGDIQKMSVQVINEMNAQYGDSEEANWPRTGLRGVVLQILQAGADPSLVSAFLEQEPAAPETEQTNKFIPYYGDEDEYNPQWSLQLTERGFVKPPVEDFLLGEVPVREVKIEKKQKLIGGQITKNRDQWYAWLQTLADYLDLNLIFADFKKWLNGKGSKNLVKTDREWYRFFQESLVEFSQVSPEVLKLVTYLKLRRDIGMLTGTSWLSGSGLDEKEGVPPKTHPLFPGVVPGGLYRSLFIENSRRVFKHDNACQEMAKYDLDTIAGLIHPERDMLLDYRGYKTLIDSGALWPLQGGHDWDTPEEYVVEFGAFEPPQWMFMRVAMHLASFEKTPMDWVQKYYDALSTLLVVPSESVFRQSGTLHPNFMEDHAGMVLDFFESIYESIYVAAVNTKWTGTVSLNWQHVRMSGHCIGGTKRVSRGIKPFLRMIEDAMVAQGRNHEECPVTITLPMWHREVDTFITLKQKETPHLQTVVVISDLFMERLKKQAEWTLFDPYIYPEAALGDSGYEKAESMIAERKKQFPNSHKVLPAQKLWNSLLKSITMGSPNIIFEGSQKPFLPFQNDHQIVYGVDGLGSIPVKVEESGKTPFVTWPAAAVNLNLCLNEDSTPSVSKLKGATYLAMRMMDNCIGLSPSYSHLSEYRPICLGVVGFYDAIHRASKKGDGEEIEKWAKQMVEAWGASVLYNDQEIFKERGAAKIFMDEKYKENITNPVGAVEFIRNRRESTGLHVQPKYDWKTTLEKVKKNGVRFSVKSVWAPFEYAAAIANATPGGIGAIPPSYLLQDEFGHPFYVPTPFLMRRLNGDAECKEKVVETFKKQNTPEAWGKEIQEMAIPSMEKWRHWIKAISMIRPYVDQGVSLTLPHNIATNDLDVLLQSSWWHGVNHIRFHLKSSIVQPQQAES